MHLNAYGTPTWRYPMNPACFWWQPKYKTGQYNTVCCCRIQIKKHFRNDGSFIVATINIVQCHVNAEFISKIRPLLLEDLGKKRNTYRFLPHDCARFIINQTNLNSAAQYQVQHENWLIWKLLRNMSSEVLTLNRKKLNGQTYYKVSSAKNHSPSSNRYILENTDNNSQRLKHSSHCFLCTASAYLRFC